MIPAGVFNQLSEIPLNKQLWFSFWSPASEPGDSGISVNYMGGSAVYVPEVFADGSVADLGSYILRTTNVFYNFGSTSPAPKDFNQLAYTEKNITIYWDDPGTCSVYTIYQSGGGTLNWAISGGGGSGVVPDFYPVTPDLKFQNQFNVSLTQDQNLSFSGSGDTFMHGFIVVVP